MSIYFIDFHDGDGGYIDFIGSDLSRFEEARDEAVEMLPHVIRRKLADGEHSEFTVTVRDEAGTKLYRATLTFYGEKLS